jgi:hypothetical protein
MNTRLTGTVCVKTTASPGARASKSGVFAAAGVTTNSISPSRHTRPTNRLLMAPSYYVVSAEGKGKPMISVLSRHLTGVMSFVAGRITAIGSDREDGLSVRASFTLLKLSLQSLQSTGTTLPIGHTLVRKEQFLMNRCCMCFAWAAELP